MSHHTRLLTTLLMMSLCLLSAGCINDFEQDFSTEFQIYDPGPNIDFVRADKRFRFSSDPNEARSVTIRRAGLTVQAPDGGDFAFLERLEVFVVDGASDVLIATTGELDLTVSSLELEVAFPFDLRGFTTDRRLTLRFVAYPERDFAAWPPGGFTVEASVTLDVML